VLRKTQWADARGSGRSKKSLTPPRRFLFRLALALGKTVGELQSTLTVREFSEWLAFASDEPIGEMRADLRAGIVAATMARVMGGSKTATPKDFMPFLNVGSDAEASAQAQAQAKANGRPMTPGRALAQEAKRAVMQAAVNRPITAVKRTRRARTPQ
jgi:hypothetical protein